MGNLIKNDIKKEKISKELEAVSEKVKKTKFKFSDILIPLLVGFVLIMLAIFVFVPMIGKALDYQREYKGIKEKEAQLNDLEAKLKLIDDATLQIDLLNAKEVIPKTLKVSSFLKYIDELAFKKNLSYKKITAGDVKVSTGEKKKGEYILGVSGPLGYTGSISNIVNFLDSLYAESPYIVSIENVSLKQTTTSEWNVQLTVTGYYVPENIAQFNMYLSFTPYTADSNVVKIFGSKASQID
jgi:large-conductance mechanosensitive channel